jgi:hypothetical protein
LGSAIDVLDIIARYGVNVVLYLAQAVGDLDVLSRHLVDLGRALTNEHIDLFEFFGDLLILSYAFLEELLYPILRLF